MTSIHKVEFICREASSPSMENPNCTGLVLASVENREFYGLIAIGECPKCKEVKVKF